MTSFSAECDDIGVSDEATRTRARFVYEEINRFCEHRASIGGFYRQEPYRLDFLAIYVRARGLRLTGLPARRRFEKRQKSLKRKQISSYDYVVSDWSISRYLESRFLSKERDRKHREMVEDLCRMWEAWDYLLDRIPCDVSKVVPKTPQPELTADELEGFRRSGAFVLLHPKDYLPSPDTQHPLWKGWPS